MTSNLNKTTTIDSTQAQIIANLLNYAGWEDDADELLEDMLQDCTLEDTLSFAKQMKQLCDTINPLLPEDVRPCGTDIENQIYELEQRLKNQ